MVCTFEFEGETYEVEEGEIGSLLLTAAAFGRAEFVRLLVAHPSVQVNETDEILGRTALSFAAENGHTAAMEALLEHRDIMTDLKDRSGRTPLSWAAGDTQLKAVQLLLTCDDVQPDSRDCTGRSPLSWASEQKVYRPVSKGSCLRLLCPVCRHLPFSTDFDLAQAPIEVDLSQVSTIEWKEGHQDPSICGLYHLVRSLYERSVKRNKDYGTSGGNIWYDRPCFMDASPLLGLPTNTLGLPRLLSQQADTYPYPDPMGDAALEQLFESIRQCNDHHLECSRSGYRLPTRLLDVGKLDSSSSLVKLLETQGIDGSYVALSHCWGNSQPYKTTRATIDKTKAGIMLEDIPATFRDAIEFTRLLGIQYLWIDSLCIVQDDVKDWETESAQMASIYQHAYLTISAVRSGSDSEGFLPHRYRRQALLKVSLSWGDSAELYACPYNGKGARYGPLDTRGWTLQEQWLSKRQIRFEAEQIVWICQRESHPKLPSDTHEQPYPVRNVEALFPDQGKYPYMPWYEMLEDYTTRKLSFASDVLPALAGLAWIVAQRDQTRSHYVAGLWWEDIGHGLCWTVDGAKSSRRFPYVAPTWSWASVDSPVTYSRTKPKLSGAWMLPIKVLELCRFLNFEVSVPGYNDYGVVLAAWIRLQAPVVPFRREYHPAGDSFKLMIEGQGSGNYFLRAWGLKCQLDESVIEVGEMKGEERKRKEDLLGVLLLEQNLGVEHNSSQDSPAQERNDPVRITGLLLNLRAHSRNSYIDEPGFEPLGPAEVFVREGIFQFTTYRKYMKSMCEDVRDLILE